MVRRGLKTIDKLDKVKEKERQMESKQAAIAAILSNAPVPSLTKTNPFAGLEVLLLPPKV
jgi:hypothetical protein